MTFTAELTIIGSIFRAFDTKEIYALSTPEKIKVTNIDAAILATIGITTARATTFLFSLY